MRSPPKDSLNPKLIHPMKIRTTSRISLITATAAILALATAAHAANIWDGGAGTGNWNDGNNWDNGFIPALAQTLTFAGDVQTVTSNNIGSFTAAGFLLTNDGTSGKTSAFTLGGPNGVTSSAAFSITTTAVTGTAITDTISLNLTLNNNASISTGASHNLIVSGAILNGTGQRTLSKTGVGELTLTNAGNTYAGATSINQGILTVDVAGGFADQGVASALGNQSTATNAQLNFNGGTLNVKSGAASTNRQIRIGSTVFNATGGAVITNNSANLSTPLVFTSAAFNNITDTGMNAVTVARTLTLGGSNTDANAITGVIADHNTAGGGTVNVTKTDAGRWILSGTNTYTGTTTVNAGTMLINGNQIGATGAINVTGATSILGGNGTIGGAVSIGANSTLAPGNSSPGLLAMNSTLTFSSVDSKLNFEIATGTRGTNYDAVNVAGLLTYNGDLTLTIGSAIANGTYDLFGGAGGGNPSSIAGSFDTIAFSGGAYSGNFTNSLGTWSATSGGQSFTFTQSTGDLIVVPEPATWALLAVSLTGMMIFRRRRA